MPVYSHSKISTFEQCPLKFKFRYVDKIIPEVEKTVEAVLGSSVHSTLEWIYKQVGNNIIPSIEEAIINYSEKWKEQFNDNVQITYKNLKEEDYFNKGVRFILNYYMKHHPFDDNTIAIEERINVTLDVNKEYTLIGYIDRLVYNLERDEFEIHDYKTGGSLPPQEKFDNDRQLPLYSLALKEKYGKDKKICFVWHYLAFDKKICSSRTDEQLEQLRKDVLELIKKIEQETEFKPCVSKLCDWCEYKSICPMWNYEIKYDKQMRLG